MHSVRPTAPRGGAASRVARTLTLRLSLLVSVIFVSPARALMIAPQDGMPLPAAVSRAVREHPELFDTAGGYRREVARLKENRRRIASGALDVSGLSRDQVTALTTVQGTRYVPVLLGKYVDTGADPIDPEAFQTELFDGPWPTGTMVEYYDEISYGNLALEGTVYDWVTVSEDDLYYTGGEYGLDPGASRTDEFIREILEANDGAIDFGLYDNDGPDGDPNSGDDDGKVDFVAIVQPEIGGEVAGQPEDNMWSHQSSLTAWGASFTTDDASAEGGNIVVDNYTIMPALSDDGGMIEIGVFCHEFGHAFGLPDLYDYSQPEEDEDTCLTDRSEGVGHWCLMGAGNWNSPERPAHMSAWAKAELGWIVPGVVEFDLSNWPIESSTTTPTAFKLWTHGLPAAEYFLVEYRRQLGFDDQLHASGLLIWHVDETQAGYGPNTDECHKLLDLECKDQTDADHILDADDLDAGTNRGDAGDVFCANDNFLPATSPSSDDYDGVDTQVRILNISGCGIQTMHATLRVGFSTNQNLCLRDCDSDVCTEPSPCPNFWASPDVYIDNNLDGVIDPPAEGITNLLWARVRNHGVVTVPNVDVDFYFAQPTMGLEFPSGADAFIGDHHVSQIAGATSEAVVVPWDLPIPPIEYSHYCVGVVVSSENDPPNSEFAPEDDNVVQINIQELVAKAGDEVPTAANRSVEAGPPTVFESEQVIRVCNPNPGPCTLEIRIGSPPDYDDAIIPPDWTVDLSFTSVFLGAGQCTPLSVTAIDAHAVHGDRAWVPLTLLCDEEPVGGTILGFEIDNVAPEPPCDLEVTRPIPPPGDVNPGAGTVRISWSKGTLDAMGFDEEVERWWIYRGDSPDFTPGFPEFLLATCLDEDPSTERYEHFADPPGDSDDVWYKIIAVDRAGNASEACTAHINLDAAEVPGQAVDPTGFALSQNSPNPFRDSTRLAYSLPSPGDVRLSVLSIDGRRVRELVAGPQTMGTHQVRWDGTDDHGRRLPAGVYVVKLAFAGLQRSQRVHLLN